MSHTILIAEDERMMLKAIAFKLQKEGYTVHTAEDGKQALELINEHIFDLVVTDIMMPYATGLELIGAIKAKSETTRIILLSSLGQEQTVLKAFSLGANDYMTKPFSPNELLIRIKKLL